MCLAKVKMTLLMLDSGRLIFADKLCALQMLSAEAGGHAIGPAERGASTYLPVAVTVGSRTSSTCLRKPQALTSHSSNANYNFDT